jgi:protein-S-isoprenylcysteine O-methyltransferase Ste14
VKKMKYLRAVIFCFSTILTYLGISLVGWGVDDLAGFFSQAQRAGYMLVVILFGLAIGFQAIDAPEGISGSKGQDNKRVKRQTILGSFMTLSFFVLLFLLPMADRHDFGTIPQNPLVRWLGLVLCGVGYSLIFWSGLALGRMYSADVTIQKDHQLITTGPYHYIRHPRYLGLILAGLGIAGLFRSWLGLVILLPLVAILLLRIMDEERLMQQEFGAAWQTYCARTWRLIPFI